MKSTVLTLRLYIFGVYAVLTYGAKCGPSEYLSAAGECCPMCNIGSVVLRDCTGDYSTSCKPCSKGMFMNEPNGLNKCFSCKSCDTGLYVLQECTTIKDTVCEVLDGYYCIQKSGRECSLASKHSECEPGQQVKTPGTKASDTVCEPCPPGFYSPKGVNCTKWTDCWVNNEVVDQEGTSITDVQCKPRRRRSVYLILIPLSALVILSVIVLYLWHRGAIKSFTQVRSPVEETGLQTSLCVTSSSNRVVKKETDSPAVT
ncbi:tumor necrosis factor receptor superfamily member 14 [Ictalurus punctatus]|uniref:Tumor necrosis factor receptor superfamily member 14 n=1 Tax=Ictalurus punctatus TaxID=7998 RepID=A0A9F7RJF7_ICTPU|nr:tumor necrosis factor receptor superfamily member 14 [Ictalurus punctatus]